MRKLRRARRALRTAPVSSIPTVGPPASKQSGVENKKIVEIDFNGKAVWEQGAADNGIPWRVKRR